jgi:hypothetical protein
VKKLKMSTDTAVTILKSSGIDGLDEAINEAKAKGWENLTVVFNEKDDGTFEVLVENPDVTTPADTKELVNKAVEVDAERRYTLAPWYPPNRLDAHGDWADTDGVEKAWYQYMNNASPDIYLQHNPDVLAGRRTDGVIWPFEVTLPLAKADGSVTEYTFPAGTPFLGVTWEPGAWELVQKGEIRGYSIGGKTNKLEVDLPEG